MSSFKVIIKNSLLLVAFLTLFFVFSAENVHAGAFGGLKVKTKLIYPSKEVWLNGATATVSSTTNANYLGRCDTGGSYVTKKCTTAGIVKLMGIGVTDECHSTVAMKSGHNGNVGEIYFGTGKNSTKTKPNTGGYAFSSCNCAFEIKLSAPAAPSGWVYDGNWHVWSGGKWVDLGSGNTHTTSKWGNDSEYQPIYGIKVKKDTPPDSFSYSLSCTGSTTIGGLVCDSTHTTVCTIIPNHPAEPNHTISYRWDLNYDGEFNDSGEGWGSASQKPYTFNHNDIFSPSGPSTASRTIKAQAKCSGGIEGDPQTITFTLNRGPRTFACDSLTAKPAFGIIPLNVQFIAKVSDSWQNKAGCGILADRYEWDFDTGETRTTTGANGNVTNYTYANQGNFTARFFAYFGATKVDPCTNNTIGIGSEYWTESNWTEVAP